MYTVNHRQRKHKIFLRFVILVLPFVILLGALIWFFFFKNSGSSTTNFQKAGTQVATVQPVTKDFTNQFFKITLPSTWMDLGRKNPYSYAVYYEFQNTQKNYDNRWLRVYVDVYPDFQAINKLLPVSVGDNKLLPGMLSEECSTFTGAPSAGNLSQAGSQTWQAKWQGVEFICDMSEPENYVGTASADEGYGVTVAGPTSGRHKYFILYIDHNIHPDYQVMINAVKSFEAI